MRDVRSCGPLEIVQGLEQSDANGITPNRIFWIFLFKDDSLILGAWLWSDPDFANNRVARSPVRSSPHDGQFPFIAVFSHPKKAN